MKRTYNKPVITIDLYKFTGMLCTSQSSVSVNNDEEDYIIGG